MVDGQPLALPASAEAARVELRVDLLVSSEERTILATLLHRAWTPRHAAGVPAYPEPRTWSWSMQAPGSTSAFASCFGAGPNTYAACRFGWASRPRSPA